MSSRLRIPITVFGASLMLTPSVGVHINTRLRDDDQVRA
jgi:hypothetical protein